MICATPVSLIFTSLLREKGWCRGMTEREAKAIEWLKDVRDHNVINLEFMDLVAQVLIRSIEELQKYREIGTVEKFQEVSNIIKEIEEAESEELAETIDEYIEELEKKIEEYKAIGTVEECRAAIEKQKAKKPVYKETHTEKNKSTSIIPYKK